MPRSVDSAVVDDVVADLADEQAALGAILGGLGEADWRRPTRCEGWEVSDVVLHLAQTDELAIGSLTGRFAEVISELAGDARPATSVDQGVAAMVARERGADVADLRARWTRASDRLVSLLRDGDGSTRVEWVAGRLSLRTLATTRLAETWIHAGDVAGAVGKTIPDTDRLRLIARLAWRTLPYAFASAGREMAGPVAFRLVSPSGAAWDLVPDQPEQTTIAGPAAELCAVAARRVDPAATSLRAVGPDAAAVLALVRTYA